jgi:hypothetical protein
VRSDDVFPLGDNGHAYWTGYFTSRPALKRYIRANSAFLNAVRQAQAIGTAAGARVAGARGGAGAAGELEAFAEAMGVASADAGADSVVKSAGLEGSAMTAESSTFLAASLESSEVSLAGLQADIDIFTAERAADAAQMQLLITALSDVGLTDAGEELQDA